MKKLFILPVLFTLALLVLGIWIGGGVASFFLFLDPVSLVLVTIPVFLILLTHNSVGQMARYFAIAGENCRADENEIRRGIVFFSTMTRLFYTAGFMGTTYGTIAMLGFMKPENAARGLSAALVTVFYSIILVLTLSTPFKAALEQKLHK